jgi:BMFP domain-containing protein YqiC
MIHLEKINALSSKIKEIAESSPLEGASKNANALLKSALTKMELVTREEFDVQMELLKKSQSKILALEQKIEALEQQLASTNAQK